VFDSQFGGMEGEEQFEVQDVMLDEVGPFINLIRLLLF
jgi:hypothetical protein